MNAHSAADFFRLGHGRTRQPFGSTGSVTSLIDPVIQYNIRSLLFANILISLIVTSAPFIMSNNYQDLDYPNLKSCRVRLNGSSNSTRPPVTLPRDVRISSTMVFSDAPYDFSLGTSYCGVVSLALFFMLFEMVGRFYPAWTAQR